MLQDMAALAHNFANYRSLTCTAIWHWYESILTYIRVESSRHETFAPSRDHENWLFSGESVEDY